MYSFWFRVILGGFHCKLYPGKSENWNFTLWPGRFGGGVYHQFYLGKTDFSLYLSLVSVCLYICTGISLYILISWPFRMGSHWWHWTVKSWLSALAVLNGERGDISWYILISWLFRMGSHWWHWTVKSGLSALAVLNGERGDISWYILISWPFWMVSHWQHWTVKSWLSPLAVSNGGVNHHFYLGKSENLSLFQVLLLLHRALSFLIRNERPTKALKALQWK